MVAPLCRWRFPGPVSWRSRTRVCWNPVEHLSSERGQRVSSSGRGAEPTRGATTSRVSSCRLMTDWLTDPPRYIRDTGTIFLEPPPFHGGCFAWLPVFHLTLPSTACRPPPALGRFIFLVRGRHRQGPALFDPALLLFDGKFFLSCVHTRGE